MAVSSKGALSFKVIAHVGKGEQVMVCGDAPFLGGGEPERALPLYTTPADYPLWFSQEDLPRPAGSKGNTGHGYRYCVYRGGRFSRWDKVEQPRVIRPSKTPHIARDTLDREPSDNNNNSDECSSSSSSSSSAKHQDDTLSQSQRDDTDDTSIAAERERPSQGPRHDQPSPSGDQDSENTTTSPHTGAAVSSAVPTGVAASAGGISPGGAIDGSGQQFKMPSFTAARTAATAAAFLQDGGFPGQEGEAVAVEEEEERVLEEASKEVSQAAAAEDDEDAENEITDSVASLQFGAEELNRRQRHQQQREGGHGLSNASSVGEVAAAVAAGVGLRRPPSLEAEDGEDAGLGLGLRLGVEAMSSPPPMRTVADKGKTFPPLWSPRDGSVVVASFYLPVTLTKTKRPVSGVTATATAAASSTGDDGAAAAAAAAAGDADCSSADVSDGGDEDGEGETVWTAEWDYEQLIALQTNLRVVRVGTVKCADQIGEDDKAAVASALLKLNCVPVFLTKSLTHQCYYSYCKGVLWPVLHGMLEMYDNIPNSNSILDDKALTEGWQAYKQVNRAFRDKGPSPTVRSIRSRNPPVTQRDPGSNLSEEINDWTEQIVEVFHEGDMVWIHGFHLAILPAFLGRTVKVARIGLFLHTPFPPSEVFRALPHREDLLRGMLGADQVGFHRFADSQHFMYSCRRLLGLTHLHSQETGVVQILHGGKPTILTDRHAGIDPEAVRASLRKKASMDEVARLKGLHKDRVVVAGVERVEKIKGVWLKMLAFEDMLQRHPHLVGRVSMHEIGIANPARGSDYRACQESLSELAGRMNAKHGDGTVIYEERDAKDATLAQRAALMSVASVFVKTPVHNGLSTMPMEFRVVQEHRRAAVKDAPASTSGERDEPSPAPAPGVLILSEAVSCSPVLRGSFSVNPWQVQAVADAMAVAVTADEVDRTAWHEEDAEWCESNTTAKWAEDVLGVLITVPKETRSRYATTGLGLTCRVVGTDPTFKRLDTSSARRAYCLSKQRVFFLDYGGTLVKDTTTAQYGTTRQDNHGNHHSRRKSKGLRLLPERAVLEGLSELCRDPCNTVFVISGRGKEELQEAFGHIKELGLAAEHGSFFRWPCGRGRESEASRGSRGVVGGDESLGGSDGWEALHPGLMDTAWKAVARRFMQDFQMHTHGSYIEEKGTAILWHYGDAEPEFGAMQAKQLQDELTDVLRSSEGVTKTAPVEGLVLAGPAATGICPTATAPGIAEARGAANMYPNHRCTNSGVHVGKNVNMSTIATSVSTTAITGSSRSSSSVASESLGGIDITHEEGRNSDAGGGGAYLEVRARGASKGNFVHMVMDRLGWRPECSTFPDHAPGGADDEGGDDEGASDPRVCTADAPGGRFCLCVGDDVSDEDMFIAAKCYERAATSKDRCAWSGVPATATPPPCPTSSSGGKENLTSSALLSGRRQPMQQHQQQQQQQQPSCLLTVTVGSKPSDADAWLPGVDAVVSLLRILGRMTSPDALAQRSRFAAHAAAVAISNSPLLEATPRGGGSAHSVSPTRCWRSASAGYAESIAAAAAAKRPPMPTIPGAVAEGGDACDSVPGVSSAVGAVNYGQGVPVMRRHSYTIGGKPRISLSLSEFLNSVAQPETEPPSF